MAIASGSNLGIGFNAGFSTGPANFTGVRLKGLVSGRTGVERPSGVLPSGMGFGSSAWSGGRFTGSGPVEPAVPPVFAGFLGRSRVVVP
ncbi:MAG: hypothetical protein Kow0069_32700 [Promethearchaeota archaeon]